MMVRMNVPQSRDMPWHLDTPLHNHLEWQHRSVRRSTVILNGNIEACAMRSPQTPPQCCSIRSLTPSWRAVGAA